MSVKLALRLMLSSLVMVIIFHLLIVSGLIPYSITWGGRLKNDSEMYVFETISILINSFLIFVLAVKGGYLRFKVNKRFVRVTLWIFFGLFLLNTIGNIFAKTLFEKFFAVLTLLYAVLMFRIARQDTPIKG